VAPDESLFAEPESVETVEDCYFYHVMDVPGHGLVGDAWDLRGGEREYLGGVPLDGRRVLEIGPASGFLTFHMESCGAEVVAVELGADSDWDIVPHAGLDIEPIRLERRKIMEQLRNGFWFAHERFRSSARVHYGSAYELSDGLGRFDVAVLGSVLLHTRDPLKVLENCARLADCLVISDLHVPELDGRPVAELYPRADSPQWDTWWRLSPELVVRFVEVLGFQDVTVTKHQQRYVHSGSEVDMALFTVVARSRSSVGSP
jgi:SAM-dependent methyltransferase